MNMTLLQYNIFNDENFNAIKKAEDDVSEIWRSMSIKDTVRSGNKIISYIERIFNICLGGGKKYYLFNTQHIIQK